METWSAWLEMLQLGLFHLPYSLTPVDSAHSFRHPILPDLAARAKAFTGTGTVTVSHSHSHSHGSREPESQEHQGSSIANKQQANVGIKIQEPGNWKG